MTSTPTTSLLALPAPTRRPISCEVVNFRDNSVYVFQYNDGSVEEIVNPSHAASVAQSMDIFEYHQFMEQQNEGE